ncbi:uncharacterized protein LOC123311374 [Coccinella septempunctata]|uniref:uncharacterized protein LOC123311374 n=1 Tax=Coccinella septempunctata TaxID=41139 RepID=UPI001D08B286|nr:uncharacterized protein LOC123311374 [Coccinella septempunctata]
MNINFLNTDCMNRKLFMDLIDCFGLKITSTEPTRVFTDVNGHTSTSKVDYILTNAEQSECKVEVFDAFIGDHRTILLDFTTELETMPQSVSKLVRNLSSL